MPTVKQISIKSATSATGYDTREIGAEAINVEVQYDASGNIITDLNTQTPDSSKTESLAEVLDNNAPKNHADTTTKYGAASQTKYGHVKVGAGLDVTNGEVSVKYGTTAGTAVEGNDTRLSDDRKNPNALSFADGTSYDGSVAKSIDADSVDAAVKNHASATDEFGAGTQTMFGHVKVSDVYNTDLGTASTSLAASQHAIYEVYKEAVKGSGSAGRELTKAEYDALTPDEKSDGTIYFITDWNQGGGTGASTAAEVSYDNTVSELTSDNVQGAIDELVGDLASKADRLTYNESSSTLLLQSGGVTLSSVHIEGGSIATIVHVQTHEKSWWNNPAVTIDVKDSDEDINNGHFDANGDYIVKVHHLGTYTVTVTDDQGHKYVTTFEDNQLGAILYVFVEPYGWEGWLKSASMAITTYSSLEDVLADEKALRELFTKHASVDYLVTWLSQPSANVVAHQILDCDYVAKWINLRDYALDMLYANAIIKAVMDEVDKYGYGEWTAIEKNCIDKSNTANMTSCTQLPNYSKDKAFQDTISDSDRFIAANNTTIANYYIGYEFPTLTKLDNIRFGVHTSGKTFVLRVKSSTDGSTWENLTDAVSVSVSNYTYFKIETIHKKEVKFIKFVIESANVTTSGDSSYYLSIGGIKAIANVWQPKGAVPVMTSNTAPYGEVSASSAASGYEAYKAFNNDNSTLWASSTSDITNARLQYKFTNPICVNKVKIKTVYSGSLRLKTFSILGSNNGTDWETIREVETLQNTNEEQYERVFENDKYYIYIALGNLTTYQTDVEVQELQFYGRSLNVSVPKMTSNTAPWGEVIGSSEHSDYPAWKAFNGDAINVQGWTSTEVTDAWIAYDFGTDVKINVVHIVPYIYDSKNRVKDFIVQGYDGNNWINIYEDTVPSATTFTEYYYSFANNESYSKYRLFVKNNYGTSDDLIIVDELQFYGVDYSEREFEEGSTMKYIYDHGVELEELVESGWSDGPYTFVPVIRKADHLEFRTTSNVECVVGIYKDLTPYKLFRVKFGMTMVKNSPNNNYGNLVTTLTKALSTTSFNTIKSDDKNLPNNIYDDISNINTTNYAVVQTWNGTQLDIEEFWLE